MFSAGPSIMSRERLPMGAPPSGAAGRDDWWTKRGRRPAERETGRTDEDHVEEALADRRKAPNTSLLAVGEVATRLPAAGAAREPPGRGVSPKSETKKTHYTSRAQNMCFFY